MHKKLPLVITCSSGKNSSVRMLIGFFNHRFKRRRGPQIKRVWRLNIVMSINQNSGVIWVDQLFTIDNGMSWGLVYGRRLSHRTITVCHFISDYNAVRRLPFFWTTTVTRDVVIVALGVDAHVVLTRTPLLKEARRKRVFLGGGGRRRSWPIIDENSASNLNYVHFFIEAASIKSSKTSSRTSRPRRHFWVINPFKREALIYAII